MISERRTFLKTCSCLVLGGVTAPLALSTPAVAKRKWAVKELTYQHFEGWIGSAFGVNQEGSPEVSLKLLSVEDNAKRFQGREDATLQLEGFSVLFEGPQETPLEQGCYDFSHPQHGEFNVMMTPVVSNRPAVRQYEVIFCRLLEKEN